MTKRGTLQTIDGLPVKNLTKKIKLVITKADCIKGKSKAPNACAAAVACTRQLPGCIEARVHVGRVYIKVREGRKEFWLRGKTPGGLRTEIATFDRGGRFEPGTYDINPLCPTDRANGRRQGHTPKVARSNGDNPRPKPKLLKGVRGDAREEYRAKA